MTAKLLGFSGWCCEEVCFCVVTKSPSQEKETHTNTHPGRLPGNNMSTKRTHHVRVSMASGRGTCSNVSCSHLALGQIPATVLGITQKTFENQTKPQDANHQHDHHNHLSKRLILQLLGSRLHTKQHRELHHGVFQQSARNLNESTPVPETIYRSCFVVFM